MIASVLGSIGRWVYLAAWFLLSVAWSAELLLRVGVLLGLVTDPAGSFGWFWDHSVKHFWSTTISVVLCAPYSLANAVAMQFRPAEDTLDENGR